ncbi:MAG: type II secretion system protein [bacterium]|nr:type II secretion system protein [bacterium]
MHHRRHPFQFAKKAGFTLIELLVVIAIIGLLSSITFATLRIADRKSWGARSAQDLRTVALALDLYYQDNGTYPPSSASSLSTGGWSTVLGVALQPYLKTMPYPKFSSCCVGGFMTQGYIYYRKTSGGSPMRIRFWNGVTNTFASCLILNEGYWMDFILPDQSSLTLNDGGADPDAIETGRGDYRITHNPADCP